MSSKTIGPALRNSRHPHLIRGDELLAARETQKAPLQQTSVVDWVRHHLRIEPDEAQCRVLTTPLKRGIINCTRQWGKSTIGAAKAVHLALSAPDRLIIVVSPTNRQSGELVRKAETFVIRMGMKPKGDGDNEVSLAFPNGSRIVGLPDIEATARGFSAVSLVLIDEASRVNDDMYFAVRPMLAASDGSLWMMSTPFGQRGFFWETWDQGGSEWERISVPASACPRISEAFLLQEQRTMIESWFKQEYCCQFNGSVGAIFTRELIQKAMTRDVKPLDI